VITALLCVAAPWATALGQEPLRLVPTPQQVELLTGRFPLSGALTIRLGNPADPDDRFASEQLAEELKGRLGLSVPVAAEPVSAAGGEHVLVLAATARTTGLTTSPTDLAGLGEEGYALEVTPEGLRIAANTAAGLFWGVQTAKQLVRGNLREGALPCVRIRDWPAIQWRGYSDDITRGPSPTLAFLKREVRLAAELKLNFITYYMEHQFVHPKHPDIAPPDGALSTEELAELVAYARRYHIEIIGNQQSFGHFYNILRLPACAALAENPSVISPAFDETYALLDDLYADQATVLPFPFFNVCCDEVGGLGDGPAKDMVQQRGLEAVYAGHLTRIHDLLRDKHGKRMMMWADIALSHPAILDLLPRDTIMLDWAYDPRDDFVPTITPLTDRGFEFFVCPGVSNWGRMVPDFATATTNIRNFVRDGAAHGALGVLNTTWDDEGENLFEPNWYGIAWGAECSWRPAADDEQFRRSFDAAVFGDQAELVARAAQMLAQAHRLPEYGGLASGQFWVDRWITAGANPSTLEQQASELAGIARSALELLANAARAAPANHDVLPAWQLAANRLMYIARRDLSYARTSHAYAAAHARSDRTAAAAALRYALADVAILRDYLARIGREYQRLYVAENRSYYLAENLAKYRRALDTYDQRRAALEAAIARLQSGELVPPEQLGLATLEAGPRRLTPDVVATEPLWPEAPWLDRGSRWRIGMRVEAGDVDRLEAPLQVLLPAPPQLLADRLRPGWAYLLLTDPQGGDVQLPAQLDPRPDGWLLTAVLPRRLPAGSALHLELYLGARDLEGPPGVPTVGITDAPFAMKRISNGCFTTQLGPEGAHLYTWEVAALGGLDITEPGVSGWTGLADTGGADRAAPYDLVCVARGPIWASFECVPQGEAGAGTTKTINVFAGAPWAEVMVSPAPRYFWDFDDPALFAGDSAVPATYLFQDGSTGPVPASGEQRQVQGAPQHWAVKRRADGLTTGIVCPEAACDFRVGPGGGWGGVGYESGAPGAHFLLFGGVLGAAEVPAYLNALASTFDARRPLRTTLGAWEVRPPGA